MKTQSKIPEGYVRVTQVLQSYSTLNLIDPAVLAIAADRGSRVHAYCEAYALNLFVGDIDDDCKHYLDSFKVWYDSSIQELIFTEVRMNSSTYKLSGAFDMIVALKGDTKLTLVDIKTPASTSQSWQLQTAAYQILAKEVLGVDVQRRICLQLPKTIDSRAKIVEYENHEKDKDLFLKALELYRFFN
jgi:hypothetical protein